MQVLTYFILLPNKTIIKVQLLPDQTTNNQNIDVSTGLQVCI